MLPSLRRCTAALPRTTTGNRLRFLSTPARQHPTNNKTLDLLDYFQRTITLSLFAITCAGAYTLGEGAYHIIGKRYGFLKPIAAPAPEVPPPPPPPAPVAEPPKKGWLW